MQMLRARSSRAILLAVLALLVVTGVAYAIDRSLGHTPVAGVVPTEEITPQNESATAGIPPAKNPHTTTPQGVTLNLDSVIETEAGYVFTGNLSWNDSVFPTDKRMSPERVVPTLEDGNGEDIPVEEVELSPLYGDHKMFWSIQTNRKAFVGPLVFSVPWMEASYEAPAVEFEVDLGTNPKIGQTWDIQRDFIIEGHTVRLVSVQLTNPLDECAQAGLEFKVELDAQKMEVLLADRNVEPSGGQTCGGIRGTTDGLMAFNALSYETIPTGIHHFSLTSRIPYAVRGPWQTTWDPPLASEPIPTTEPEACLTRETWEQVMGRNDALPPGLGGKIVTLIPEEGKPLWVRSVSLSSVDGMDLQKIAEGLPHASLSNDGRRLAYSTEEGSQLHIVDLSTGESTPLGREGFDVIWSPDNTRMMYTNTYNLYVLNADGSGYQTIDTSPAQVVLPVGWLADNQTILYIASAENGEDFKSYNLQSGEKKDLFSVRSKAGFGAVSPDGEWIVFTDNEFGAIGSSIFISRIDGSDRKRIAEPAVAYSAAWGPDGQWLILNGWSVNTTEANVLVNPFTCESLHVNRIHGSVEDWSP